MGVAKIVLISGRNSDVMAQILEIQTSLGAFELELYHQHAPKACYNFKELANIGYFDSTTFHRLVPDFIIQGGDPSGTGKGGESIFGGRFEDEISSELHFTGAGILAMANSGPNSNGSQFFITLAPTPTLNGKHTIFGRVLSGMKVVQKLGNVATGEDDRPQTSLDVVSIKPKV